GNIIDSNPFPIRIDTGMDHSRPFHANEYWLQASDLLNRLLKRPDVVISVGNSGNTQRVLYDTHQFRLKGLNVPGRPFLFEHLCQTCQIANRCFISSTHCPLALTFRMKHECFLKEGSVK